jgi:hypothetical protein
MKPLTLLALALVSSLPACREEVPLGAWEFQPAPGSGGGTGTGSGGGTGTGTEGGPGQGGDTGTSSGDAGLPACREFKAPGPLNEPGIVFGATETATDWTWPAPMTSMQWDLMVEREIERASATAPPTSGYYWAHQFSFLEGIVGWLGIQAEGGYQIDPTEIEFTKIAVFWLSGPPLAAELGDIAYPEARVAPQTAAGVNYMTIHARFDWQACRTYRFRLSPAGVETDGTTWYGAWIEDVDSGEEILLGRMLLPADSGPLAPYSMSRTLAIEFGEPTSCSVPAYGSALFGKPRAGEDGVQALLETNRFDIPLRCPSSRFTEFDTAVRHELGVPL